MIIGAALSDKAPQGFIRTALGVVLIGSGIVTDPEGRPERLADRRRRRRRSASALILVRPALAEQAPREREAASKLATARPISTPDAVG